MLKRAATFQETYDNFVWDIPEFYNIGTDICDKWAETSPSRRAIIDIDEGGVASTINFETLRHRSNQLSNALVRLGISGKSYGVGDRVGVLLPQRVETALSHISVTKIGAISIPLFTLFGEDALLHRLKDSGAKTVITDHIGAAKLVNIRTHLPDLEHVICVDSPQANTLNFDQICDAESALFDPVETRAEDPALIIYTSGTTGNPKGALHAHRVLLGHLPGVEISHNFLPEPDDVIWTPADWAWIGGLLDVLMPALHHGIPVVARRFKKFSPEAAFELMKSQGVRNAFLPPTAIKMMRQMPDIETQGLTLRSVGSGGETLGGELIAWGQKALGATINEFYGQTECNMVISSCAALEPPTPGIMGRPVPGHIVDIISTETGERAADNREGAIAVLAPDPVMFLRYWDNPKATKEKFVDGPEGRWLVMGDRGVRHPDGKLEFIGRDDDVISSAGYRIGPAEIEDCLLQHPAVQLAGVVGMPDDLRGQIVCAYVTLADGFEGSVDLASEIASHVRNKLAAYEYPRVVRFIDAMPMTTTGKIIRRELRDMAKAEAATHSTPASD